MHALMFGHGICITLISDLKSVCVCLLSTFTCSTLRACMYTRERDMKKERTH